MEMFHLLKDSKQEFIVVMAFRESGKSTIMNMANVLWSILGKPQKRFVIVVSQTQEQAKNHFTNIKEELSHNELLREDFGPFTDDEAEWKKMSLELVYHESKILSVSREQSIRGIKYDSIRPDLIICDDLEDSSARFDKTKRDELYARFVSEITPLGSAGTRIVVLGNLICEDSLIMRLKKDIEENKQRGIFRVYPIIDNDRRILWQEKFQNIEKIKELWNRFPEGVWAREFLLKLLGFSDNDESPVIVFIKTFGEEDRLTEELKKSNTDEYKFPRQQALIPQMEEFNIAPPEHNRPPLVFRRKDEPMYRQLYGNVYLDKPIMGIEEQDMELNKLAKEYEENLKKEEDISGI